MNWKRIICLFKGHKYDKMKLALGIPYCERCGKCIND